MEANQLSVVQIAKRFRRGGRLILLGWVLTWVLLFYVAFTFEQAITIVLLYVVLVILVYLLIMLKNYQFSRVNKLFYEECDPRAMAEVYGWLAVHRCERRRRYRQAVLLYAAQGICCAGDFDGALRYIEEHLGRELAAGKVRGVGYTLYINILTICCFQQGNIPGMEDARAKLVQYRATQRRQFQKVTDQAIGVIDSSLLFLRGNWGEARLAHERFLSECRHKFQQVGARYCIALCDLNEGKLEAARGHLEFAARFGGTMYQANRARAELERLNSL